MKKFRIYLLHKIAKWLIGEHVFNKIEELVKMYANENISGEAKRKMVFEKIKATAKNLPSYLINLGIETAVTYLKSRV